ncbi:hypothetical protein [Mucilaginibacter sp.]
MIGFSHTHLSGRGGSDLGDILVMPATGAVLQAKGNKEDMNRGYLSGFSHKNEVCKPTYYQVLLQAIS